jgi:hypothetical protein
MVILKSEKKSYPKIKESLYAFIFSNTFNKENFINTFKYEIPDDKVVQTKFKFFQTDILNSLFTSTQKEINLNYLVPFIDGNQYNTFADVLFTTENLFFFLTFSKNLINIPNLQSFKVIKRGEGIKIE